MIEDYPERVSKRDEKALDYYRMAEQLGDQWADEDGTVHHGDEDPLSMKFQDGGSFILDAPDETPSIWGDGKQVAWAEGEALMICGGNGVGKTTTGGQVVRGRLGLAGEVLGLPVAPTSGKILYLAMDRPKQIAKALKRNFRPEDRHVLSEQLVFWKGPPVKDLAQNPSALLAMCHQAGADTVVVDSLKDAAVGLSSDEVGAGWNRARQTALAAGVECLELHHMTKRDSNGSAPRSIADVYGSAWLTSGAGSVILLHGNPGDPLVEMVHLKPPNDEIGPWKILHDHDTGTSTVHNESDPYGTFTHHAAIRGVTARRLAEVLYCEQDGESTRRVKDGDVEKARRKLRRWVDQGRAIEVKPTQPGDPVMYHPRVDLRSAS